MGICQHSRHVFTPLRWNMNIFLVHGNQRVLVTCATVQQVYYFIEKDLLQIYGGSLPHEALSPFVVYNGRFLPNRDVSLAAHGIQEGDTLHYDLRGRLRGGNSSFEHSWETAISRLEAMPRMDFSHRLMSLQGSDSDGEFVHSILSRLRLDTPVETVALVEDVVLLTAQLCRARGVTDIILAALVFIKLRTNGSLLHNSMTMVKAFIAETFPEEMQLQSSVDEWVAGVTNFRSLFTKWEEVKETTMAKKVMKLGTYLVGYGCFSAVGLEPSEHAAKLADTAKANPWKHSSFLLHLIDTLSFTLQRSLIFMKTGDWNSFLHGPKTYGDWFDACMKVKREALGLGNLNAHDTTYFKFVNDLKEQIEIGKSIVNFATKKEGPEFRAARQLLNDLLMINATVLTRKAAQQERKAPFGVLVHGDSSVGKSHFTKALYYYYGKLFNLPIEDDYRYVRQADRKSVV